MVLGDFLVYAILAVVALVGFIGNYPKKVVMVVAFFIMSALLYGAVNAAYSTKETFNPELHDCTKYEQNFSFGWYSSNLYPYNNDTPTDKSCQAVAPFVKNSKLLSFKRDYTSGEFDKYYYVECGECVSWQPKKQGKIMIGDFETISTCTIFENATHVARYCNITAIQQIENEVYDYCQENPSDSERCERVKFKNKIIGYNPSIQIWIFENKGRGNDFVLENFTNISRSHMLYDISYVLEVDGVLISTGDREIAYYFIKRNVTLTIIAQENTEFPLTIDVCVEAVPR